jgi:hypothetical protein
MGLLNTGEASFRRMQYPVIAAFGNDATIPSQAK